MRRRHGTHRRRIDALLSESQGGDTALINRGFEVTPNLALYQKDEPLRPTAFSILERWSGELIAPSRWASMMAEELHRASEDLLGLEHVVVFIDEVDDIASSRAARPETQAVVNELLKAIVRVRDAPGRLLVYATNSIAALDPAVVRPGRFDLVVQIATAPQRSNASADCKNNPSADRTLRRSDSRDHSD